ncbi:MAG: nickel/cobalt transporter [Alphaproteobacteria bacterium]|nr:nickel/cobalt transporter [Alphaproteobacteria bacterium]MDX5416713.1 nickel/cobalt transporter [Alphaproteobacteria bacterium]MDX5494097.1 nickel/cobalt transporter [Alphaproteobacteria bacterium]
MRHGVALIAAFAALAFSLALPALAQSPFAVPGTEPASAPEPGFLSDLMRYIVAMQQDYYRAMAGALRAVNLQQSVAAVWGLVSISFLYGVFHAAGPGHGKIVVTSYLLADERDVHRGILLAFLSAFAQAVTAILIVGILAMIIGLSSRGTADAVPVIERASFILIAGVGLWLIWQAASRARGHGHAHHHHAHDHSHEHPHGPECSHDHAHAHMPTPAEIRAASDWKGMAAMILSVGLRPCSGAILVLLFALTQGAFAVGVLSAVAMSVGTAITVSALAILTVFSKNVALRFAGTVDSPRTRRIELGLRLAGGIALVLLGGMLLWASLASPSSPLF